jgi:drug/metabolite transporter (DMT)-like permease
MAAVVLHERLTRLLLAGLAVGITGLVLLLEPWSLDWSDARVLAGLALLLLAALVSAATTVHVRAHRWHATPLELLPWEFGLATVPILALAWAVDGAPSFAWSAPLGLIVVYQFALASAFGEWGAVTVMRSLPAITSNLAFMAVPAVGLAASIAFVDEPASATTLLSLVLVLGGVVLGLLADRRRRDSIAPISA